MSDSEKLIDLKGHYLYLETKIRDDQTMDFLQGKEFKVRVHRVFREQKIY
jgi:hypothetical protein